MVIHDMPNEFQRVMDSLLGHLPEVSVYLDETPIAIRGSKERHWWEVKKMLQVLNDNNAAVKRSKCTRFAKEIEWLGFKISKTCT